MTTAGTMEIAHGGTVINETHTQAPERQGAVTKLHGLAEWDKRLLENLRARIADSGEYEAKYEVFMVSFEAYLKIPPEQRKVCSARIPSEAFLTNACSRPHSVSTRVMSSKGSSGGS